MTEDVQLLEAVERYLLGEMSEAERMHFEDLRKSRPEVDQMVVEHNLFLQQMAQYGDRKEIKAILHDTYNHLEAAGAIKPEMPKLRFMSPKYRRVFAVAASIAGLTALAMSGMVAYFSPKSNPSEIALLKKEINAVKKTAEKTQSQVNTFKVPVIESDPVRPADPGKFGGTGFLIDGRGYLVTSAHVVAKADSVYIINAKGDYFKAKTLLVNDHTDIAILKIVDNRFNSISKLPYGIRSSRSELGEQIFTLGYPRTEIVYNEGYLSAKTGFNGDTAAYQIAISANPGNSGGPIFNQNGEVIGVLSGKQLTAEGVVFSSQSKNIFRAIDSLRKDTSNITIRLPLHSSLKGIERVQQIKKIEECVFNVMSY